MRAVRVLWVCALSTVLGGCAGTGNEAMRDPAAKLHHAEDLYERQDRPLTAEKLIREAIETYRQGSDQVGLAEAYRTYGFFLRSESVEGKWSKHFVDEGFLDTSVTFENRYEKSIDYLEKARTIFEAYRRYDSLTNINLNIGFTYEVLGNLEAACRAFDRSVGNNRDSQVLDTHLQVGLPKGFATYEDFLAPHRKRAGCEETKKRPGKQRGIMSA